MHLSSALRMENGQDKRKHQTTNKQERHVHLERERAQNTALDADGVRHGWPSHTTARATTASHQHTRGWAGIGGNEKSKITYLGIVTEFIADTHNKRIYTLQMLLI